MRQKTEASTWVEEQNKRMQGRTDNDKYSDVYKASDLYTPPDASASGGIRGQISNPSQAIQLALAIPPDKPELVYRGSVEGEDKTGFRFQGLPPSRYDLFILTESALHEGLRLHRGDHTLTSTDMVSIQKAVDKAEKFYTRKVIHRIVGETGRMTGVARGICTFVREKESLDNRYVSYSEWRRHFYLTTLNDVGPGWQIVANRDLGGIFVKPDKSVIPVNHRKSLSGIRVADSVVDLGTINLSKVENESGR